jgi:hypothetical protein
VDVSGLFAGPTLFRLDCKFKSGIAFALVGGGDTVWVKEKDDSWTEFHQGKLDEDNAFNNALRFFHGISWPDRLLALKGKDYHVTDLDDQAVNGVQAVALRVKHACEPEAVLYFDKDTRLPVKAHLKFPPAKEVNSFEALLRGKQLESIEVYFDDYKEFDGLRHYTKLRVRAGEEADTACEIRELKLLKKVEPGAFKKPG